MKVLPVALHHPAAVRDALARRGVPLDQAESAASGLQPVACVLDCLSESDRDAVARAARTVGVSCLTGDGWAVLAGAAGSVAGLARADSGLPRDAVTGIAGAASAALDPPRMWDLARGSLSLERPTLVGILNLTPDSFSDGGRYLSPDAAMRHADSMVEAGAQMLDVGAESTRPGRPEPVDQAEEWRRLGPVLVQLQQRFPQLAISVDTVKSDVARRALDAGAWAINDVSGLRLDPGIADICAAAGAGLILMHSRGSITDMATYDHATYQDLGSELVAELSRAVTVAEQRGVSRSRIALDPGLGFSKTPDQSYEALRQIPALLALGFPVMVGPSRKRFLESSTGRGLAERDLATAGACVAAYHLGARLFRVHAVAPSRDALAVAHAVAVGEPGGAG